MYTFVKITAVTALLGIGGLILAGRTLRDAGNYAYTSAETAVAGLAGGLPREVRDKKLDNDLARCAELVERRIKLNLSARHIEQFRQALETQAKRADRDRRVLADAWPILERATRTKQANVQFATEQLPLSDFQREIDNLLFRQSRDIEELAAKREALSRLESRQRQAEQALADSSHALEAAEREVALLKSRREQAEIEGQTIALVCAISNNLNAPKESVGESLGRLRDEVANLECGNEVQSVQSGKANGRAGETIVREFDRVKALKELRDKLKAERNTPAPASDRVEDSSSID